MVCSVEGGGIVSVSYTHLYSSSERIEKSDKMTNKMNTVNVPAMDYILMLKSPLQKCVMTRRIVLMDTITLVPKRSLFPYSLTRLSQYLVDCPLGTHSTMITLLGGKKKLEL